MTNLELSKNKAKELNVSNYIVICNLCYKLKNQGKGCDGINCNYCEFNNIEKCIDYLLAEHKEPIKLKKWEYDLIRTNDCSHENLFYTFATYRNMKRVGHFSGIKDTSMTLEEILNNCEVVDD